MSRCRCDSPASRPILASQNCSTRSTSRGLRRAGRRRSPSERRNEWPLHGRSRTGRKSSWRTSRPPPWMQTGPLRSSRHSNSREPRSAQLSSSPRTTRTSPESRRRGIVWTTARSPGSREPKPYHGSRNATPDAAMDDARDRMLRFVGRARDVILANAARGIDQVKTPLYRNAFFIMLTSVIGQGLGFFFWIVLSNRYQKVDIGAAIALFATLSFLAALGLLGQGTGLVRYLPEAEDKGALVNAALTVTALLSLGLSVVFLVVGIPLLLPELSFVLRDPLYVLTIIVCTVTLGVAPILDQASIAVRRADLQTWRNTIFAVLKIPFAFVIASVLSGRAGVFPSLTLAWSVSVLVAGFALLPQALPRYVPRPQLRIQALRPMLRFSLGNYVAAVIGAGATSLSLPLIYVVLGSNAGPTNAAYFYVASIVAGLPVIIPPAGVSPFFPHGAPPPPRRPPP